MVCLFTKKTNKTITHEICIFFFDLKLHPLLLSPFENMFDIITPYSPNFKH